MMDGLSIGHWRERLGDALDSAGFDDGGWEDWRGNNAGRMLRCESHGIFRYL